MTLNIERTIIYSSRVIIDNTLQGEIPTFEKILDIVNNSLNLYPNHGLDATYLANVILTFYDTSINEEAPIIFDQNTRNDWRKRRLESGELEFNRWNLQKEYLKEKGFPENSFVSIDNHTNEVLDSMGDPLSEDHFDYRNLVCGQIQSGKTTAYLSLVNKALDSGYKTVIIFTGRTEDLRIQTNAELDRMVYGKSTNSNGAAVRIGIGSLVNGPFGKIKKYTNQTFGNSNLRSSSPIELGKSFTFAMKDGDFKQSYATRLTAGSTKIISSESLPSLLVVKKIPSVIKNIINAVQENNSFSADNPNDQGSVLIIDDEIDDASINTNQRNEGAAPTATNRLIRKLIENIAKVSYVGYTATPFAPVLQPVESDQEIDIYGRDIYPNDGIFVLPTPSNYLGTSKLFGYWIKEDGFESGVDSIFPGIIPSNDGQSWTPSINYIPDSLKSAVRDFIIATCLKDSRESNKDFHSMLVHITFENDKNEIIKEAIEEYIKNLYERFDNYDAEKWQESYENFIKTCIDNIEYLNNVEEKSSEDNPDYEKYNYDRFFDGIEYPDWEAIKRDIKKLLKELNEKINESEISLDIDANNQSTSPVKIVNADGDVLPYTGNDSNVSDLTLSERCIIAVGGFKLSRGMVIKNLTVSYYLRRAQQQAADTILQMGRWFGYRDNYQDLIRLHTSEELINDHKAACEQSEQIRQEFLEKYHEVRVSPDGNIITPRNISPLLRGNAAIIPTARRKRIDSLEIVPDINNKFRESLKFEKDKIGHNLNALNSFISSLEKDPEDQLINLDSADGFRWKNISHEKIIDFLKPTQRNIHYKGPFNTTKSYTAGLIAKYIYNQVEKGMMQNWTVGLISDNTRNENPYVKIASKFNISPLSRKIEHYNTPSEKNISFRGIAIGTWPFFDMCKNEEEINLKLQEYKALRGEKIPNTSPAEYTGDGMTNAYRRRIERPNDQALLLLYLISPSNLDQYDGLELDKPLVGFGIETAFIEKPKIESFNRRIDQETLDRLGHDEWHWTDEAYR